MKFEDLYRLLKESEKQLEFDLGDDRMAGYTSWADFLHDNDSGISKQELKILIKRFDASYEWINKPKLLKLYDSEHTMWLESEDGEEFDVWAKSEDDLVQSAYGMQDYHLLEYIGLTEDDIYIDGWESTIGDFCKNPGTVYHYTTEDGWEGIQADGGINTGYGTGLTNRHTSGVFCSTNREEHATGTYGDVCLALDLASYMKNNNLEKIEAEPEPEVFETAIRNQFYHKMGIADRQDESSYDMSTFTVVVGHSIPVKYIERLN